MPAATDSLRGELGISSEASANYRLAGGGRMQFEIVCLLLCMHHLHNVLGHTVWVAQSTREYTVGNNNALAPEGEGRGKWAWMI